MLGQLDSGGITAVEYVPSPLGLRLSHTDIAKLGKAFTQTGVFQEDRWTLLDVVPLAHKLSEGVRALGG